MSLVSSLARNGRGFRLILAALGVVSVIATLSLMMARLGYRDSAWRRWLPFAPVAAAQGERIFRDKGCSHCHAIGGEGGMLAPDLAKISPEQASLPRLVAAMWNHAPRMWERMRSEKLPFPELSQEEAAQLLAYLFRAGGLDQPGNSGAGEAVFAAKQCARCHAIRDVGGRLASDLTAQHYENGLARMQPMFANAPEMQAALARTGMPWPRFEAGELNDLLTYLQGAERQASSPELGDPDRGWEVYQSKSCLACHSVKEESAPLVPSLGPPTRLPASRIGIAALMWNDLPQMQDGIKRRRLSKFSFEGNELADLIAFIQGLRYFDPPGSPQIGQTVFSARGCAGCHGESGQGTSAAPALRRPGHIYNSASLTAVLWSHGVKIYQQAQRIGLGWPALQESDVGDLLAFVNRPARTQR